MLDSLNFEFMFNDILNAYKEFWIKATDFKGFTSRSDWWLVQFCLLYTSPSPRDLSTSRMPSSA